MNSEIFLQPRSAGMLCAVVAVAAMRMLAALPPRLFKLLPGHDLRFMRALFISIVSHAQRGTHPVDKGERNRPGTDGVAIRTFGWLAGFAHPSPSREFPALATFIMISGHEFFSLCQNVCQSMPCRSFRRGCSGTHYATKEQIARNPARKDAFDARDSSRQFRNVHLENKQHEEHEPKNCPGCPG